MEEMLNKTHNYNESMDRLIYIKSPITFHDNIPIFSEHNNYIKAYEQIANEHLNAMTENCPNPWIDETSWQVMENSTSNMIRKWCQVDSMILDVGVGLGRLLEMIPGIKKYGMDIAIPYLVESEKKGIKVCMASIEDIPYRKELFDLAICTDVLEHVLDFNLCVTQILSVLKPEGVLIIRVPYKESLESYTQEEYPYYYSHIRSFDEHSLALQFSRSFKCEVLDISFSLYLRRIEKLKYHFPVLISKNMQMNFIRIVNRIAPKYSNNILKKMVDPVFINMAFRKSN